MPDPIAAPATPFALYDALLGESLGPRLVSTLEPIAPQRRARIGEDLAQFYAEAASATPAVSGEAPAAFAFRPAPDLPRAVSLVAPPETALAAVLDPLALRREVMAAPIKLALLLGDGLSLADPVARLLAPGAPPPAEPQLRAALGLLAELRPLAEAGVVRLYGAGLAADAPDPAATAFGCRIADAARLRGRPGWAAIKATRDPAFDRFALGDMAAGWIRALDRARRAGAPAQAVLAGREVATEAAALGDVLWALEHYDLADLDLSPLAPLSQDLLAERRRDGRHERVEAPIGGREAPFGHWARLSTRLSPAPGAIALGEVVALRRGEEAFEAWRGLVAAFAAEAAALQGEEADPRAAPSADLRARLAEWEAHAGAALARSKLGRAFEAGREKRLEATVALALSGPSGAAALVLGVAAPGDGA